MNLMVKILFSLCLILFFEVSVFGQEKLNKNMSELEVKYMFSFVRDTMDLDMSHRINEVMILDLNTNSSIYYSEGFMKRRMAIENVVNIARNSNTSPEIKIADLPKSAIGYSVYRENSRIYVTNNLYRDFYTFEADFPKWNTNFHEKKDILGYQCYRATVLFNKKMYTAWYTKDIPISEGPYRFKGLPGLILELSDEKGYNEFHVIGIEKKQVEIKQFQKGIPITREQYIQKREEFRINPYPGRVMDKTKREKLVESNKKNNNLLER